MTRRITPNWNPRGWRRGFPPVASRTPGPLSPAFELVLDATAAEAARRGATLAEIRDGMTADGHECPGGTW